MNCSIMIHFLHILSVFQFFMENLGVETLAIKFVAEPIRTSWLSV